MQEPGAPQIGDGAISQQGIIGRVVSWFSFNKARFRDATIDTLRFGAPVEVTISSGAVTLTSSNHNLRGEGDANDTLNTINAWDPSGMMIILTADTETITLAHGADNILCWGDQNITVAPGDAAIIIRPDPTSTNYIAIGDTFSSSSHARSHTVTNTSDHTANANKVLYTDDSGNVTEVAVGADGTVFTGTGTGDAPAFESPVGHRHSNEDSYNGSFIEPFTFVVASNGTVITGTLDANPSGDLTERFSDGRTTASSGITVTLTAGSDTSPKKNFVYILQSNKGVLVASDSDWPAAEHIRIAEVIVQSASKVQTDSGGLVNRNWNDFTQGPTGQGHHLHAWERTRFEHSAWKSGGAITWTITTNGGAADEVDLAVTAAKVYQMHLQTFGAKNTGTGTNVHVVNDKTTPYTEVSDFADLLTDNDGGSMSSRYFNLVAWGSISSGSEIEHLFVNLPGGSYVKQGDAIADVSGYTVFDIPAAFRGKAFLITRITLRHQAASSGTWTSIQETDLRGQVPNIVAGGGTAAITTEFADNQFTVFDDGDPTKEIAFQASSISASTKRTITMPDEDVTLNAPTSTTAAGIVELATAGEMATGTDSGRVPSVSLMPVIIQDSKYTFAADAEASDTYAISMTPNIAAYATGQKFIFTANTANTGACTLDVDGKGAKAIKKNHDVDLADNDIESGSVVEVVYDGSVMQMVSQLANAGGGGGDVTKVGTPANDQIGVWTGDGTIEGNANATIDSAGAAEFTAITGHGIGSVGQAGATLRISPAVPGRTSQFSALDASPVITAGAAGQSFRALQGTPLLNTATYSTTEFSGLYFQAVVSPSGGGTPVITHMQGVYCIVQKVGAGVLTITDLSPVRSQGAISGSNLTATRFNGLWSDYAGSSQVTDMTGLRIDDITAGTQKVLIWAGPNVPSSTGVTNLRLDAGNPTDQADADLGDSQLYLTFMENGSLAMRNIQWKEADDLTTNDQVLVAV